MLQRLRLEGLDADLELEEIGIGQKLQELLVLCDRYIDLGHEAERHFPGIVVDHEVAEDFLRVGPVSGKIIVGDHDHRRAQVHEEPDLPDNLGRGLAPDFPSVGVDHVAEAAVVGAPPGCLHGHGSVLRDVRADEVPPGRRGFLHVRFRYLLVCFLVGAGPEVADELRPRFLRLSYEDDIGQVLELPHHIGRPDPADDEAASHAPPLHEFDYLQGPPELVRDQGNADDVKGPIDDTLIGGAAHMLVMEDQIMAGRGEGSHSRKGVGSEKGAGIHVGDVLHGPAYDIIRAARAY